MARVPASPIKLASASLYPWSVLSPIGNGSQRQATAPVEHWLHVDVDSKTLDLQVRQRPVQELRIVAADEAGNDAIGTFLNPQHFGYGVQTAQVALQAADFFQASGQLVLENRQVQVTLDDGSTVDAIAWQIGA